MGKGSCLQTALNSYRLMCVTSSAKDFSSEFLHQTQEKTFSRWLPCRFRRSLVLVFHCSMSPRSSYCTKASKSKAFKEKLRCPMSTHSLICQALGNTFLVFGENLRTMTKLNWKALPALMESKVWIESLCLAVCKAWLLAIVSIRAWRTSLCPAICKAWLLAIISTRAWRTSLCPALCEA